MISFYDASICEDDWYTIHGIPRGEKNGQFRVGIESNNQNDIRTRLAAG